MLKKSDLARQFELVVQQEIKNFNDSLNFILQSLKKLNEQIEIVQNESLSNHALLKSNQVFLIAEANKFNTANTSLDLKLENNLNDQGCFNQRSINEIQNLKNAVSSFADLQEFYKSKIQDLHNEIQLLKTSITSLKSVVSDNYDDLLRLFRQEIQKAKKDVIDLPSSSSIEINQLDEKISSHKVDVAGIMRELNVYKKENFVTQKNIENIYTLIERLSRSEVLP